MGVHLLKVTQARKGNGSVRIDQRSGPPFDAHELAPTIDALGTIAKIDGDTMNTIDVNQIEGTRAWLVRWASISTWMPNVHMQSQVVHACAAETAIIPDL
jgi:hypothetical protein